MYTTLHLLKTVNACVPGFTKQLEFFGTSKEVKDQKIPLHVLTLIGGVEDAIWAVANGLIIDPEQFAEFRKRTILTVFKSVLWSKQNELDVSLILAEMEDPDLNEDEPKEVSVLGEHQWWDDVGDLTLREKIKNLFVGKDVFSKDDPGISIPRRSREKVFQKSKSGSKKNPLNKELMPLYIRAVLSETPEEIEQLLLDMRNLSFEGNVFLSAASWSGWLEPRIYIDRVLEMAVQAVSDNIRKRSPVKQKYWFLEKHSSRAAVAARILRPQGTYDFLRKMKFKHPLGVKILVEGDNVNFSSNSPEKSFLLLKTLNRGLSIDELDESEDSTLSDDEDTATTLIEGSTSHWAQEEEPLSRSA